MVHVLQRIAVSKPARSTVAEPVSKDGHVTLAGHDAPKASVRGYSELIAIAGKYCLQLRSLSSNPRDEVLHLLGLAVLGWCHEHHLRPLSAHQPAIKALQFIGDLVLPPAELHAGMEVFAKRPKAVLAFLPQEVVSPKRKLNLRKNARITRKPCHRPLGGTQQVGHLRQTKKFKRCIGSSTNRSDAALFL